MEGYKNKELSFQERAVDLVSRMSLEEKVSQVGNVASAIPRLEVPAYNYWSEASHGITGIFLPIIFGEFRIFQEPRAFRQQMGNPI